MTDPVGEKFTLGSTAFFYIYECAQKELKNNICLLFSAYRLIYNNNLLGKHSHIPLQCILLHWHMILDEAVQKV